MTCNARHRIHTYDHGYGFPDAQIVHLRLESRLIRRGRPKSDYPKQQITLRLDAVLRWFQQSGPGYPSRIGAALKSHMTRQQAAAKTQRGKTVRKRKAR